MKDVYVITGAVALTAILSVPINRAFDAYIEPQVKTIVVKEESAKENCEGKYMEVAISGGHYMLDHVGEVVVETALKFKNGNSIVDYCLLAGMTDNGTCNDEAVLRTARSNWNMAASCMPELVIPIDED